MKVGLKSALALAVVVALAGCSNAKHGAGGMGANGLNGGANFTGQNINGEDSGTNMVNLTPEQLAQVQALPKTIYFGFNQYELTQESKDQLKQNVQFLVNNPDVPMLIGGNTDPRGSQEYNFHLGERRANAVKDYLVQQGVSANQLCTVSYGELKPAANPKDMQGDWQKAYQLDRRADLNYGQTCQGQ
jgi:peptidoglycan-associated lipoprotein